MVRLFLYLLIRPFLARWENRTRNGRIQLSGEHRPLAVACFGHSVFGIRSIRFGRVRSRGQVRSVPYENVFVQWRAQGLKSQARVPDA